ncbi:MAG: ATP-binding cassette domain-containing protein [Holosporales bacterium]|nr:ATP-binding cassette domain-containing protein [Holosporales bacterium]
MLSVRNLHVTLGNRQILKGVDFDLKDGESLVILGCSGTGKSVLLKSILGLIPKQYGKIVVDGIDIDQVHKDERSKILSSIGMLFQGGALFDSLPVWENVAFGLIYGRGMKLQDAKEIAIDKLTLVDLDKQIALLYPPALSGGMLKRVGLARALASMPRIIFFDEPTTGLDPITSNIVNDLIVKYVKHSDLGAITITHDLTCLRKIADTVAFLFDGKIIWTGSIQGMDCTENPYVRQFIDAIPIGPLTTKKHLK